MPRVIRKYKGSCEIKFSTGVVLNSSFELALSEDCRQTVTCPIEPVSEEGKRILNEKSHLEASLSGRTEDGGAVSLSRMVLKDRNVQFDKGALSASLFFWVASPVEISYGQIEERPATVTFGLLNFVFGGCDWTAIENKRIRNKFSATLGTTQFTFTHLEDYDETVKRLESEGGVGLTSTITVQTTGTQVKTIEPLVRDSLMLMSLASANFVNWLYEDTVIDGRLVLTRLPPKKVFSYYNFTSVLDCRNIPNCVLKEFMESTIGNYQQLKTKLGLGIAIELYLASLRADYLNTRYLLLCTVLECLGSYVPAYLRENGKELPVGSISSTREKIQRILGEHLDRVNDALVADLVKELAYNSPQTKDKIGALLDEFHVPSEEGELQYTKIRARIVHTGDFPKGINPLPETLKLTNLVDRIMLTILGYRGVYLDAANGYTAVPLPPPKPQSSQ